MRDDDETVSTHRESKRIAPYEVSCRKLDRKARRSGIDLTTSSWVHIWGRQGLLPRGSGCRTVETSTRWGVLSYLLREVVRRGGAARIARAQSHLPCEVVGGGGADRIPHARGPMSGDLLRRGTVPQPVVEVPLPRAGRRQPADPRCGSPRPKRPAGSAFRQSCNRCPTGVRRRRPPPRSRRRPDPVPRPYSRALPVDRCTVISASRRM